MDRNSSEFPSAIVKLSVVVHELLHTLGLHGHPPADEFPASIMRDLSLLLADRVPAVDGAALRVLYTRYPAATEPEDVDVNSLGSWDSEETHLTGDFGDMAFGVYPHNGVAVPWTGGTAPSTTLAGNRSIGDTAVWNGSLLGATPARNGVAGSARVSVNVGSLTGRADFADLRSWAPENAAGAVAGTAPGVRWNTGSLGYTLAVNGNYIRSTGGEDGVVAGRFYGRSHQGVAGSLERPDLAAAFGAKR